MYFKGPIWSTKVHKVLQSERKKTCVLQWITKHENSCLKGQKFSFYQSTKTHQVFHSERKKANVLQWIHKVKTSCPKGHQQSTKVHQPDPLKYISSCPKGHQSSTKVHQPDPLKHSPFPKEFLAFFTKKFLEKDAFKKEYLWKECIKNVLNQVSRGTLYLVTISVLTIITSVGPTWTDSRLMDPYNQCRTMDPHSNCTYLDHSLKYLGNGLGLNRSSRPDSGLPVFFLPGLRTF